MNSTDLPSIYSHCSSHNSLNSLIPSFSFSSCAILLIAHYMHSVSSRWFIMSSYKSSKVSSRSASLILDTNSTHPHVYICNPSSSNFNSTCPATLCWRLFNGGSVMNSFSCLLNISSSSDEDATD